MNHQATVQAKRLLLIEDDVRLAGLIKEYLEAEHFHIDVRYRGDDAITDFHPDQVDIVILDLMLPGINGLEVCSRLRQNYRGPILILTAKNSDIDHVMALELGADDFVNKPIEPPVLLARVRALLRRSQEQGQSTSTMDSMAFGQLRINLNAREALLDGTVIDLTTQEFELLCFLAENAGKVLDRDKIFAAIRGIDYDGLDRTVDVRISRLRKKLGDNPENPTRIKTVWGKGYLFVADAWV